MLAVTGCASPVPPDARLPDTQRAAVSGSILLVGDTQEHSITGLPLGLLNGSVDHWLAPVTIRPPQQALFGHKLYEFLGASAGAANMPIVHLGDVVDHSCRGELDRIFNIAKKINAPVAFAPGNHDGLLQGIFNPLHDDAVWGLGAISWDYVCRNPEPATLAKRTRPDVFWSISDAYGVTKSTRLLSKDQFIEQYLTFLMSPSRNGGLRRCVNALAPICYESDGGFHAGVYARIIPRQPGCGANDSCPNFTRSFLVQMLRLPVAKGRKEFRLILIDTTQTDRKFKFAFSTIFSNPGKAGYLQKDQLDLIEALARQAADEGHVVLFGGHHHWTSLDSDARDRLSRIFTSLPQAPIYMSAHQHRGFWAKHDLASGTLLEFNISSLADWPIDARKVHFEQSQDQTRLGVVATPAVGPDTMDDAGLLAAWMRALCDTEAVGLSRPAFDGYARAQANIVRRHYAGIVTPPKMGSESYPPAVPKSSGRYPDSRYVDNLNDTRMALLSFAALLDYSQPARDWLDQLDVSVWTPASCAMMVWVSPSERLRCAASQSNLDSTRHTLENLAGITDTLQDLIRTASIETHPQVARLMACTHIQAAYHDWRNGFFRRLVKLGPEFFQTQAVSRREPGQ